MRGPVKIFFDLSHDCMIDGCNSFVTKADDVHDLFHLPACLARVAHSARACTLFRLFGDLVVSYACRCSGSDCVRVVTSAHQRSGSCTSGSLSVACVFLSAWSGSYIRSPGNPV